jgi:hypothetical protein
MPSMKLSVPVGFPLATAFIVSSCTQVTAQASPFEASSKTVKVRGEYSPLRLDEVRAVSLKDGQFIVRGSSESVTVALPAMVDTTKVVRHWALSTEASIEGKKVLTFTHDESLDDFTLELPETEAEIRYGVFEGRDGNEVMVLTWGRETKCYWGYVTLARAASSGAGPSPAAR